MRRPTLSIIVGVLLSLPISPVYSSDETHKTEALKPLQYYELIPSVVANVQKGAKYMRADIQLMTREDGGVEAIEFHAAALRHELFLLISDQDGAQLKNSRGKEKFRKDALKSLQKVMQHLTGKEVVEELYFTSYFVQ